MAWESLSPTITVTDLRTFLSQTTSLISFFFTTTGTVPLSNVVWILVWRFRKAGECPRAWAWFFRIMTTMAFQTFSSPNFLTIPTSSFITTAGDRSVRRNWKRDLACSREELLAGESDWRILITTAGRMHLLSRD